MHGTLIIQAPVCHFNLKGVKIKDYNTYLHLKFIAWVANNIGSADMPFYSL